MQTEKLLKIIGIVLILISAISILPNGDLTIGMFILLLIGIIIMVFGFFKKD